MNPSPSRSWWLSIENVHAHHDAASAISLPEIAPFLDGRQPCFRWPPQGDDRPNYHRMETGDTGLLWTGPNPEGYPGWGVLGFATIYVRDIGLEYPEVLLTRDWIPDFTMTPYDAHMKPGPKARTPEADFLWQELGKDFAPLVELFTQLGYMEGRPSPKSVYPLDIESCLAIRHRMLARAA